MQFHEKLCEARGESREFVASNGWLWRFSQRHGIRQLLMQGEKLSSDVPAATDFIASFEGFIEENKYTQIKYSTAMRRGSITNYCLKNASF